MIDLYKGLRFRKVIKELKLNQKEVATELGTSQAAISEIIRGKRPFTTGQIAKLVIRFGVSEQWLLTGEGEMLKDLQSRNVDSAELDKLKAELNSKCAELDNLKALMAEKERVISLLMEMKGQK